MKFISRDKNTTIHAIGVKNAANQKDKRLFQKDKELNFFDEAKHEYLLNYGKLMI